MGSLFASCMPACNPEDITLRASRVIREASLVAACDAPAAAGLVRHYGAATPVVDLAHTDEILAALETGDVLLLLKGENASLPPPAQALLESALSRGHRVVAVPGPSLPMAALVISGLPTDSYVYVDHLPESSRERRELLAVLAGERRTFVLPTERSALKERLPELQATLGDRLAVLVVDAVAGTVAAWRGRLGDLPVAVFKGHPAQHVLVVGGAREPLPCWAEDRLSAEIQSRLEKGIEAKEVARQLAAVSGWPRREIYRRAIHAARPMTSGRAQ